MRKTQAAKFQLYDNRFQKWLFLVASTFLLLGAVLGLAAYCWHQQYVALVALILLALASLLGLAYQVASAVPEFLKLKNAERETSTPLAAAFNDDMDLITELSRDFASHHLRYARDSFSLMGNQLRSRISLLVGAIDKVGIIPIAITAYISWGKAMKDGLVVFTGIEWIFAAFIFLYLFALRMCSVAQWMDRISLLYGEAFAAKKTDRQASACGSTSTLDGEIR